MKALFRQLGPAFLPYRRTLAWGIACVALTNLIALAQPLVLRFAVDDLYRGVTAEKLGRYALFLFAIATVAGLFKFAMRIALLGVSRRIEYDLRERLFDRLLLQSASWYQSSGIGDLVARATSDLANVRMMLGPGVMYLVNTVVVVIASLAFMLAISPRLTLVSLLPLPFMSLAMWLFGERIHRGSDRIQEQYARLSARAQESFTGVRVVRALGREAREEEEFRALHEEYRRRQDALTRVTSVFQPSLAFLGGLAALLALAYGGRAVVRHQITLGEFVAFTVYLGMLNWPMVALGWIISLFQRGSASWQRVHDLLEAVPEIRSPESPRTTPARGAIEVRRLSFTHAGETAPVLRDVSLRIEPGTTTVIVGATGSGKSTLLGLLVRRLEAPAGTIFLDGIELREYDLPDLRSRFGVVAQEPFLFATTLAANVTMGRSAAATDLSPRDVAEAAGLAPDLADLREGLEVEVGERGARLSGGQRQRVAIARALWREAPVLVLDDPLSSVDAMTEAAILTGLAKEAGRRTIVVVSHRAAVAERADQIVVLDEGRVVECGPPAVLRARAGAFARWLHEQQIEAELEAS